MANNAARMRISTPGGVADGSIKETMAIQEGKYVEPLQCKSTEPERKRFNIFKRERLQKNGTRGYLLDRLPR